MCALGSSVYGFKGVRCRIDGLRIQQIKFRSWDVEVKALPWSEALEGCGLADRTFSGHCGRESSPGRNRHDGKYPSLPEFRLGKTKCFQTETSSIHTWLGSSVLRSSVLPRPRPSLLRGYCCIISCAGLKRHADSQGSKGRPPISWGQPPVCVYDRFDERTGDIQTPRRFELRKDGTKEASSPNAG